MGIQGLLKLLHPLLVPPPDSIHAQQQQQQHLQNNGNTRGGGGGTKRNSTSRTNTPQIKHNIRQFTGKSLAIDASSWLHKAGYTCAETLVESIESNTRSPHAESSYTKYMLDRCSELLVNANISHIYLVFDGIRVPLKAGTNAERERKRKANLMEARRLVRMGRRGEASDKYRACVKGNEIMARVVAGAVERRWGSENGSRVKCIWSPYEADSQMVKLCVDGLAHAVVTEDSDVLVYSAVTRRPFPIIYKLDRKDGSCDVLTMDWLVNPKFLRRMNNSSNSTTTASRNGDNTTATANNGRHGRRRRRREREQQRKLDYIYNDGPLDSSEEEKSDEEEEEDSAIESDQQGQQADGDDAAEHPHACEVDYPDDMLFAPIRRALPSPSPTSTGSARGKNNKRSNKRRGSNGGSVGNNATSSGNPACLSYLRTFANKEAANPGAGVRLFVQACVLSGCDYVENRLSKVGPVTAFKLVKEASHRDCKIRFDRVLKSLPNGSKLLAEDPGTKSCEDDDDFDNDNGEYNDSLSQPDTARNAKEKYEELLSKSEAVFYYHLVTETSTGNILPLVPHNVSVPSDEEEGGDESSEVGKSYRPCIGRFDAGLPFVGSASEALAKKLEPLEPLAKGLGGNSWRNQQKQQNNYNGGWITTNKHKGSSAGASTNNKSNSYQKSTYFTKKPASAVAPKLKDPPEETSLQKYFKGQAKSTTTSMRVVGNICTKTAESADIKPQEKTNKPLIGANPFKAYARPPQNEANKSTNKIDKENASKATVAIKQRNPYFAPKSRPIETERLSTKKSPLPTSTAHRATEKSMMKSTPGILSPVKFDYGGFTPPKNDISGGKSRLKSCVDSNTSANEATCDTLSEEIDLLDSDDENEKQMRRQPATDSDESKENTPVKENAFLYDDDGESVEGIVEETPPIKVPAAGFLSDFIHQTKSCDGSQPRRVSTSPPAKFKSNGSPIHGDGCSPADSIIELIDLVDDYEPEPVAVNENLPNFNQPKKPVSKIRSSLKRPFKNPCKKTNSSAILAGFERQEKLAKTSSGSSNGSKKKSSRFFPTKTKPNSSLGKGMKGIDSYFTVPSEKKT